MKIVEVAKEIKGNAIDLSEDTLDYNVALTGPASTRSG